MLNATHRQALTEQRPAQLVAIATEAMRAGDVELATAALALLPRSERRRVRAMLEQQQRERHALEQRRDAAIAHRLQRTPGVWLDEGLR